MPNMQTTAGSARAGVEQVRLRERPRGAPVAPWTVRLATSTSSDWAAPHRKMAIEKLRISDASSPRLAPKRATSLPVKGFTHFGGQDVGHHRPGDLVLRHRHGALHLRQDARGG